LWFFCVLLVFSFFFFSLTSFEKKRADESDEILRTRKKDRQRKIFVFLKFLSSFSSLFFGFCLIICQTPKHTLKYSLSERRRRESLLQQRQKERVI